MYSCIALEEARGDACPLYSVIYSKNGRGPRSQFGPRSVPEVNKCYQFLSPQAELSTWSLFSFAVVNAIQRTRIASRPLQSYTAIQRYTGLYTIHELYIAIHYTTYATPLCVGDHLDGSFCSSMAAVGMHLPAHLPPKRRK